MTGFTPLPSFSDRLRKLLQAYGLNGNSLSKALNAIGVQCSPQHAYRLLDVAADDSPRLSAELLAGILHVCPIEPSYFFEADVTDHQHRLSTMYVKRTSQVQARPGPQRLRERQSEADH